MMLALVGAAAFLLTTAIGPRLRTFDAPSLVRAAAVLSAFLAQPARPSPTGIDVWDACLRAALAALVVLAGARARPALLAVAVAPGVLLAGGPAAAAAAVALGSCAGLAAAGFASAPVLALAATAGAQAALRLAVPGHSLASAAVAFAMLAPLLLAQARSGLRSVPVPARRAAAAAVAAFAFVATVAVLAIAMTRGTVEAAVAHARAGVGAAGRGETAAARQELAAATSGFRSAHHTLGAWWVRPALLLPVVGPHVGALRDASLSGAELGQAATAIITEIPRDLRPIDQGTVPLDQISRLAGPFEAALTAVARAEARLDDSASPWLVRPVARRVHDLRQRMEQASRAAELGALAARAAPKLFGEGGSRRYFLAIVTPAEARASGGIVGNFGEIVAEDGHLRLTRVGRDTELNGEGAESTRTLTGPPDYIRRYATFRPERSWQNVPVSLDFPTVGEVIRQLYPQSGGADLDGVISVDPFALQALLKLIGPVSVANWPVPLTKDNAADVLLHEQYLRLTEHEERVGFLGEAAAAIWAHFNESTLPGVAELTDAMGPAVHGRHLQLWSRDPEVQRLFQAMGASGQVPRVAGDSLAVVTQNASGNKIDWFMRRSIAYDVRVQPGTGDLRATVTVRLANGAPSSGLPDLVIGGYPEIKAPGVNKTYLSIYSPWPLAGDATLDGAPLGVSTERELGRFVYSAYVKVGPGRAATIRLGLRGRLDSATGYQLDLLRQPTVAPDRLHVSLRMASGWESTGGTGWSGVGASGAELAGLWDQNLHPSLGIRPTLVRAAFSGGPDGESDASPATSDGD